MARVRGRSRRRFLKSLGVPAALALGASVHNATDKAAFAESSAGPPKTEMPQRHVDLGSTRVGDDAIPFLRHTLDLGLSETVTVADMNRDGRLDIVCGENWFEQLPPIRGDSHPRFVKHKFRDLPYTPSYL